MCRILLWTFLNSLLVVESMISFRPACSESMLTVIDVISRPSTEISSLGCSVVLDCATVGKWIVVLRDVLSGEL